MLNSFTRNYDDNSTEAGFQFTFYCDCCNNGFKSTFRESSTYGRSKRANTLGRGAQALGSLLGGRLNDLGWAIERGTDIVRDNIEGRSPEWRREHEAAFNEAQTEVRPHFRKCQSCQEWVCLEDFNEDEGMCIKCAPRQEVYVAKARADAMRRNIDEAAGTATVWQGELESKTTVCPQCGKPAGKGKFCNYCGASMALNTCPTCGAQVALGVKFCGECGSPMAPQKKVCPGCGAAVEPGIKFCGSCGTKV